MSAPLAVTTPARPDQASGPRVPARAPREGLRARLGLTLLANHYPALHGLRVLGVVSVVQLHVTTAFLRLGLVPVNLFYGASFGLWFGMDLFFLLSGFLIGSMLLAETGAPGRRPSFRRFYARRAMRILPPYYVTLAILAVAAPLGPHQRDHLLAEAFYLTNYVPPLPDVTVMQWGWSLALEEHFYLLVPVLVALLSRVPRPGARLAILVALWATAPALRAWTYATRGPWSYDGLMSVLYVQTHLRYDILLAGVATAIAWRHWGELLRAWLARRSARIALGSVSLLSFAVLYLGVPWQRVALGWNVLCWGTLTTFAYVPLVLLLLDGRAALARALSPRPFLVAATLGYGIYLVHVPVIDELLAPLAARAVRDGAAPAGLVWALTSIAALGVSAALAWMLHVLVEKPALALRDRFAR